MGSDALARAACEAVLEHLNAAERGPLLISGTADETELAVPAVDFLALEALQEVQEGARRPRPDRLKLPGVVDRSGFFDRSVVAVEEGGTQPSRLY